MSIRKHEERNFMRAFEDYIVPFMKDSKEQKVIIKKDKGDTAVFEFTEENGVVTERRFPDDLLFAYQIAVDAIYDSTKADKPEYSIQADDDYAVVILI